MNVRTLVLLLVTPLTTDVHFSEILRYTPFADDPSFRVHEAVVNTAGERVFSLAVPAQQPTGERGVERERVRAGFGGSE